MKYIVIIRRLARGKVWNEKQFEFDDKDAAEAKAKEYYDSIDTSRGDEITCLVYELISALN